MRLIHYRQHVPNFGDDLNAELWPALAPALFADGEDGRGFVGIGTIIGMDVGDLDRLHVFSSGAGYDRVDRWAGKRLEVHCVRGPLTARLMGVDPALALTDGAVLTPLAPAFPDAAAGGGGVAVAPHFETIAHSGWAEACAEAGFALVDPRDPPADVVRRLAGADLVLAESLHGAVLADAYGVPWVAFGTSRNLSTSKWTDWLATLGLPYRPTLVPPPNAAQLLRFGRRPEPFGATLRFTLEDAAAEFAARTGPAAAPPGRARGLAKAVLGRAPPLQRLLGYGPSRTAEALAALARGPASLSGAGRRRDLRDRMLDGLRAVERAHGAA